MKPRVGFLGTGWIGRHRMEAMLATGAVEAVAVCDPSNECAAEAAKLAPDARQVGSLEEMLALDIDGVVIATPSALHAAQSITAFDAGKAVFCQKPLGRTAAETQAVVDAARSADRLLGVDLSQQMLDKADDSLLAMSGKAASDDECFFRGTCKESDSDFAPVRSRPAIRSLVSSGI